MNMQQAEDHATRDLFENDAQHSMAVVEHELHVISDEWDRLLDNWARWLLQRGDGGSCSISGCYQLALSGSRSRSDGGIPVTQAEAADTDTLIGKLDRVLIEALVARYCWSGAASVQARQLGCAERTLYDRVARAKLNLSRLKYEARRVWTAAA